MPDILIHGMEMPTEGGAIGIYKISGNFYAARVGKDELFPIVELPEHSDLIEAEPIKRFITDGLNRKEFGYDQIQVLTEVEYAPVIVPASEETT